MTYVETKVMFINSSKNESVAEKTISDKMNQQRITIQKIWKISNEEYAEVRENKMM